MLPRARPDDVRLPMRAAALLLVVVPLVTLIRQHDVGRPRAVRARTDCWEQD
jgi:hypothetical protein